MDLIDPQRWSEIRTAFDKIVELDSISQAERLAQLGSTDPELRQCIEQLLAADAHAATRLAHIEGFVGESRAQSENLDPLRLVGRTVSHFHVVELLARGGMGVVYRAEDTRLQRTVALKFPLPTLRLEARVKERFLHEARAAGALNHPNLCSIHEIGETADGELFLAMPLYDGETLKARLERYGPLPIAEALNVARQIAHGLTAAHDAGIVHRDLKPGNVMLCRDGNVRILDFGLAKIEDLTLTASHARIGTVSYMAPEQISGMPVKFRADLWSLGVVLFEMLTGQRPFGGEHDVSIAHAIVHAQAMPPSTLRRDIPPVVEDLVIALLQKDPAKRPASAAQVDAELGAIQLGQELPAHLRWRRRVRTSYQRLRARPRRFALAVFTISALSLTAIGWFAGDMLRSGSATTVDRSIAVLPFTNPSHQASVEYLTVGLLDGLINQLRSIQDIRVTSRHTAMGYRSSTKPLRQIANELKVATALQGTVERVGDRVRVTAKLVNARTNEQLWSDVFERQPTEILNIQEELARGIARTLGAQVTPIEQSQLDRRPTTNGQAYDLYLRGHEYELRIPTPEGQGAAEALYRQAFALDSTFALARARAAAISIDIYLNGFDLNRARLEQARADAEAALRMQPNLPEARFALGTYWGSQGEHERALEHFQLALKEAPNSAEIQAAVGYAYGGLRRSDEATAAFERALDLDPGDIRIAWALAGAYRDERRYAEAMKYENYVIARAPDGYMHMLSKGFIYLLWRASADTLAAMIKRVPSGWNNAGVMTRARLTLARVQRRPADAVAALDEARETEVNQWRPATLLRAQAYEALGDAARARAHFEAGRRAWADSVKAHPEDAQMKALLAQAYAGLDRKAEAEQLVERAIAMATRANNEIPDRFVLIVAAEVFTRTRNAERAVQVLEKLLSIPAGRHVSMATLRVDPLWDPIRSDPRFRQLLERQSAN